ncbi:MAG TPA: hypothetical protein VKS79_21145 [Gemmataceae bacterium]|nr:hypothetical protein [Gemmataceae bacterium]
MTGPIPQSFDPKRCPDCGCEIVVEWKTDYCRADGRARLFERRHCPSPTCKWEQETFLRLLKRVKSHGPVAGQGESPGLREGLFGPGDGE